jgi:predicted nucleotidyltransferase
MARVQNPNKEMLILTVEKLGQLADEMVFLGGCAAGLLITDPAAPPIRITRDVDAIVQVVSRGDYYQLSEKLRARGFQEDMSEGAPICRWISGELILDVMPTNESILGFGNQWYSAAAENSVVFELTQQRKIHMVSAPYFLITKLTAFEGRGNDDYLMSHDIEDIIAVLDGRTGIEDEIRNAQPELAQELSKRFKSLSLNTRFLESISGHLPTDSASQARGPLIINLINSIAS